MYSGSEDGTIKIWDLRAPGVIVREPACAFNDLAQDEIGHLAVHEASGALAVADDAGDVHIVDVGSMAAAPGATSGAIVALRGGHTSICTWVAFRPGIAGCECCTAGLDALCVRWDWRMRLTQSGGPLATGAAVASAVALPPVRTDFPPALKLDCMLSAALWLRDGMGIVNGDYVAMLAGNSLAYLAISFGAMCNGAVSINLNWRNPEETSKRLVSNLKPALLGLLGCGAPPQAHRVRVAPERNELVHREHARLHVGAARPRR